MWIINSSSISGPSRFQCLATLELKVSRFLSFVEKDLGFEESRLDIETIPWCWIRFSRFSTQRARFQGFLPIPDWARAASSKNVCTDFLQIRKGRLSLSTAIANLKFLKKLFASIGGQKRRQRRPQKFLSRPSLYGFENKANPWPTWTNRSFLSWIDRSLDDILEV